MRIKLSVGSKLATSMIVTIITFGSLAVFIVFQYVSKIAFNTAIILSLVILSAMMASILTIYLIIIYLFQPLKKIIKFSETIGMPNYGQKIDIMTGDEFEYLALKLNETSQRLFKNKQNIEKKIADRTNDLEKINKFMVGRELKMIELKKQLIESSGGDSKKELKKITWKLGLR